MKLSEWTYIKEASWINKATKKHLDKKIVKTYSENRLRTLLENDPNVVLPKDSELPWDMYLATLKATTFTQQNIYVFVELEDGTLVALNESPTHGWSFPTGKFKDV